MKAVTYSRRALMLKALLNRYHPQTPDEVSAVLPPEEASKLQAIPLSSSIFSPLLHEPVHLLASIHPSWIQPHLESLPLSLRSLIGACLTESQRHVLHLPPAPPPPLPTRQFLLRDLAHRLHLDQRLPLEYIPPTELTPLAHCSHAQLLALCDCLGVRDLVPVVRQRIGREELKRLYSLLTSGQSQLLKWCLTQRDFLVSPPITLDLVTQDDRTIRKKIRQRGLVRLAKGLYGQPFELVWRIAHCLDHERGTFVWRTYHPDAMPRVTPLLCQQIRQVMVLLRLEVS